MKKISIIGLALPIITLFNTAHSFVRPTILLAQAFNKAHQKVETTTNEETGTSNTNITPEPIVDYTCKVSTDLSGDRTAEILLSARPISLEDIDHTAFNKAQLAFYAATTSGIYGAGKSAAQLIKIPKTSIGKSIRKNGCCALSLILMEKYQKINELLGWETHYEKGKNKIENFINEQYKNKESIDNPEEPKD